MIFPRWTLISLCLIKSQKISENEFKREVEIEPSGRVRDSARNDVARA